MEKTEGSAASSDVSLVANGVSDTKTYTFQTVLTDVDGNVLIGATASDSIDNLIAGVAEFAVHHAGRYAEFVTLGELIKDLFGASIGVLLVLKGQWVAGLWCPAVRGQES